MESIDSQVSINTDNSCSDPEPRYANRWQLEKVTKWDENGKYVGMFLPGALYLCHCGCAIRNFLIVRGPCEGEVWRDDQASRKGIFPEVDEHGKRLRFLDWYEQWLDKSLELSGSGSTTISTSTLRTSG